MAGDRQQDPRWVVQSRRTVDLTYGFITVVTIVYLVRLLRGSWYYADDWPLALQGRSLFGWFDPYNGHLSVVIIAVYRIMLTLFGLSDYVPLQALGIICMAAVSVAMYVVNRRLLGALPAAVIALVLLWYHGMSLEPGGLNHNLVGVGAIVCFWALNQNSPRAHALVALSLTFALCSAGGGTAVAVGAVVHSLSTRASRRRWAAIIVPCLAWIGWWLAMARGQDKFDDRLRPTPLGIVRLAWADSWATFDHLVLGNRLGGRLLAAGFIIYAVRTLLHGREASANLLAGTAALGAWWLGLAYSRGFFAEPGVTRYGYLGVVFVLLAVRPTRPLEWEHLAPWAQRRWAAVAPLAVVCMAILLVVNVRPGVQKVARFQTAGERFGRAHLAVLTAVPDAVADDTMLPLILGRLTAREYKGLIAVYGRPDDVDQTNVDAFLVDKLRLRAVLLGAAPPQSPCKSLGDSLHLGPTANLRIATRASPTTVAIRRFGSQWISIGTVAAGHTARVDLPALEAEPGWQLRAPGACVSKR